MFLRRTLEEASVSDGAGELTVGGLSGGEYYTGQLQDVRIYPSMLTARYTAALHAVRVGLVNSL